MVKLVEIISTLKNQYQLRELYVNPDHVVFLREDTHMKSKLTEGILPENLDTRQRFTRLQVHNGATGTEFIVVGDPISVESKLKGSKQELLHG
jgi:hypothetical protein